MQFVAVYLDIMSASGGPIIWGYLKQIKCLLFLDAVCEQLYLDIMSASGGPIIWGYLKPIMRGKILFSPNNDITKGIIEKVFQDMTAFVIWVYLYMSISICCL